ncbi:MAG TPA: carboxypeptidase-like regulatory domain-containing protein, partial [Candidatus Polarisedimenticolaceae bacterium]|nr:carboxypeptidase-like regulatory domain-containing protein [Candidatus Polarisedimenticolaceae bacterium]
SDAEGRFRLEGLTAGPWTVHTVHPDHAPAESRVQLEPDGTPPELVVRLGNGGTITGRVLDGHKQPAANVLILANPAGLGEEALTARTGLDGRYELTHVAPGSYRMTRAADGEFRPSFRTAAVREDEITVVDFDDEGSRIKVSGRVLRGAEAIGGASLFFSILDTVNPEFKVATSGEDGRYEVGLEQSGNYRVLVQAGQRAMKGPLGSVDLAIPDQPDVQRDVVLRSGGIAGRVTDAEGHPVPGAGVLARGMTVESAQGLGRADTDGRYSVDGLADGSYRVTVTAADYRAAERAGVEVVGAAVVGGVDFRLERGGVLKGRVVDPLGQGIAGAIVFAAPAGSREAASASRGATDINGAFELVLPADGPLDLTALSRGWAPARLVGVVPPDEADGNGLLLQTSPGCRIRAMVSDAAGRPVPGVQIAVAPVQPFLGSELATFFATPAPTDAAGAVSIGALSPGAYQLLVPAQRGVAPVTALAVPEVETTAQIKLP